MKKVSIIFIIFSISIIISCKNYIEYADSNFCKNKEITYPNISLILLSNEKEYNLNLFYADEKEEYLSGLMCIKKIPEDIDGMLFEYKTEQKSSFWMYETYIPLTIIYFDNKKESIDLLEMNICRRNNIKSDLEYRKKCSDEAQKYLPSKSYKFALEIPSNHKHIEEIKTNLKDQKVKLIINN